MSRYDKIPKRPPSFQHVIKLDTTLGNLKFASNGIIDPVFGMPIAAVMLNDNIKASTEYLEYLKKSVGAPTTVVKGVTEEVDESKQMDDLGDSEETEEEEVLDIKKAQKASKEDFYIQQRSKDSSEGYSNSSSSSSSSYSEVAVEDISSDEDEVTKKADNAKTTDVEKDTED
ncbi:hypothetical protein Tco_1500655 [Tanacetum coccineum]